MTKAKPVALVTGASSGIGKAASLALVEAGFEVVGTSRNVSAVAQHDGADAEALLAARLERVSLDDSARQAQPNPLHPQQGARHHG